MQLVLNGGPSHWRQAELELSWCTSWDTLQKIPTEHTTDNGKTNNWNVSNGSNWSHFTSLWSSPDWLHNPRVRRLSFLPLSQDSAQKMAQNASYHYIWATSNNGECQEIPPTKESTVVNHSCYSHQKGSWAATASTSSDGLLHSLGLHRWFCNRKRIRICSCLC